jgi:tetratricopeptide (TPR) repeat protein
MRWCSAVLIPLFLYTAPVIAQTKKPTPKPGDKKPAEPTKEEQAATLAEQATKDLKAGEYQFALEGFKAAYELVPDEPGFLLNIGVCYQSLKEYQKAKDSYLEFLKIAPPKHPARPKVNAKIAEVELELSKLPKPVEPVSQPVSTSVPVIVVVKEPPPPPSHKGRPFFLASGATGAGALGVATVIFLSVNQGRSEEQAAKDATLQNDPISADSHFASMGKLYGRAKLLAPIADGLLAGTVALGAVGLVLRLKKDQGSAVVLSPNGVSFALQF